MKKICIKEMIFIGEKHLQVSVELNGRTETGQMKQNQFKYNVESNSQYWFLMKTERAGGLVSFHTQSYRSCLSAFPWDPVEAVLMKSFVLEIKASLKNKFNCG